MASKEALSGDELASVVKACGEVVRLGGIPLGIQSKAQNLLASAIDELQSRLPKPEVKGA